MKILYLLLVIPLATLGLCGQGHAQYTDAVSVCGADPTGATDSTTAITSCIASYSAVSFPTGTFQACNVVINNSSASIVGTQAILSPQLPAPAAPGGTVFTCASSTASIFVLKNSPGSLYISVYMSGFSCTKPGTVIPTAGSCISGAPGAYCVPCTFSNIMSTNQFIGFAIPAGNGLLRDVWAFNNYGDGFFFTQNSGQNMQWDADRLFATLNSGWGVHVSNHSGSLAVIGHWTDSGTFADGLGGLFAEGDANSSINDWNLVNWGASDENGDCMRFQTYGDSITINGGLIEACGRPGVGHVGRNQSIPPTTIPANGINFSMNNGSAMVANVYVNGTTASGIGAAGVLNRLTISNSTLTDDALTAGACGANCNAITIYPSNTRAVVTGNQVVFTSTPHAGYALLSNSPLTTATGNILQNGSSGAACGGAAYAKAGNVVSSGIGAGC